MSSELRLSALFPFTPSLVESVFSDERRLKQYLEEESWVPFFHEDATVTQQTSRQHLVTISARFPSSFKRRDKEFALRVADYYFRLNESRLRRGLDLPPQVALDFAFELRPKPLRLPLPRRRIRGRTLLDWTKLYLAGKSFALDLGYENEERYIYIEALFEEPAPYSSIEERTFEDNSQLLFLVGDPKAGKTYTSLRLLHKAFVEGKRRIYYEPILQEAVQDLPARALESLQKNTCLLAYIEDPFGIDIYDITRTELFLHLLDTLAKLDCRDGVQLLVSSRRSVFERACSGHRFLQEGESFDFSLSRDAPAYSSPSYTQAQLEDIFERVAWLEKARWLPEYRRFLDRDRRKLPRRSAQPLAESDLAWRSCVTPSAAPGSLYNLAVLYPSLFDLRCEDPSEIRVVASYAQRPDDLRDAFNSELVNMLAGEELNDVGDMVCLYLLLPAMTLVDQHVLDALFTDQELDLLSRYRRLLLKRSSSGAYSVRSLKYAHDSIAEAARKLLLREGALLLERRILPWLLKRETRTESWLEVLVDLLCTYYALGGKPTPVPTRCEDLLSPDQRQWVVTVGLLFEAERGEIDIRKFAEWLAAQPLADIARLSSMIDQLLIIGVESEEGINVSLAATLFEDFNRSLIAGATDSMRVLLKSSVLLHSLLAHLEILFVRRTQGRDFLVALQSIVDSVAQNAQLSLDYYIVWLDALLMKIGELHAFLVIRRRVQKQVERRPLSQLATKIRSLKEDLMKQLLVVWDNASQAAREQEKEDYLRGGLLFTLAWHDRWATVGEPDSEVEDWIGKSRLEDFAESETPAFWEGVSFNVNYHAHYFYAKAGAWARESSIYLWREAEPRIGADSLHESGLPITSRDETINARHEAFLSRAFDSLVEDAAYSVTAEAIANASFVLGLRVPRQPTLNAKLAERLASSLGNPGSPASVGFWSGVGRLFQYSLQASWGVILEHLRVIKGQVELGDLAPLVDGLPDRSLGDLEYLYNELTVSEVR